MVEVSDRANRPAALRLLLLVAGTAAVGTGILGIGSGSFWAPATLDFFYGNEIAQKFELVIPFLPILLIALGTFLAVESRQ